MHHRDNHSSTHGLLSLKQNKTKINKSLLYIHSPTSEKKRYIAFFIEKTLQVVRGIFKKFINTKPILCILNRGIFASKLLHFFFSFPLISFSGVSPIPDSNETLLERRGRGKGLVHFHLRQMLNYLFHFFSIRLLKIHGINYYLLKYVQPL